MKKTKSANRASTVKKETARTAWQLKAQLQPLRRGRRLRPPAKPHPEDATVVEWLYRRRVATTFQIQRKFPHLLQSARSAQRQITRLKDLRLLKAIPTRGVAANWPDCLQVTRRGLRLIRDDYRTRAAEPPYSMSETSWRSRGVAARTALHELCVTDVDLLVEATAERSDVRLLSIERRWNSSDAQLRFHQPQGWKRIEPDSFYLLEVFQAGRWRLRPVFLEVQNGTGGSLLKKINGYWQWSQPEAGEKWLAELFTRSECVDDPTFDLWLVVQDVHHEGDDGELALAFSKAIGFRRDFRERLYITSGKACSRIASFGSPLAQPIWHRAVNVEPFRHYQRQLSLLSERSASAALARHVRQQLPNLPRYSPLFFSDRSD